MDQTTIHSRMMMEVFPFNIRLGQDRNHELGMVWDESGGGVNGMDSVMLSRRTSSGWTNRRCLAPGRYPDVLCWHASLVPGDSTDFTVAFSRWTSNPSTEQVEVWSVNDSNVLSPQVFAGTRPLSCRRGGFAYLVFRREDSLFGSVNRGEGWMPEELVATGIGWGAPGLCADAMGWAWTCWPDSFHQSLLASYNSGTGWSRPETVATHSSLGSPRMASDEVGVLHCVWFDHPAGTEGRLRHAVRLTRPGIEERTDDRGQRTKAGATVVRGVLVLRQATSDRRQGTSHLLDISGRKVMTLQAGPNDVSRLSPGVYFARDVASGERPAVDVHKVILVR